MTERTVGFALVTCVVLAGCSDEPTEDVEVQQVECRLNSDCPEGRLCEDGSCIEDDEGCEGPDCPCTQDADCGVGEACDGGSGECFALECLRDVGCALGEVCLQGRCETDVDADRDRDGVPDTEDLCPEVQDADQEDNDGDGAGDACDGDDDDDGRSDTIDNCPFVHNPLQGDADGDGLGNACDGDTPGIDVGGLLDFSALPGADTADAQVFISGRASPEGIDERGAFVFDDVLDEPGQYLVRVAWPGFVPIVQEFDAPDAQPAVTLSPMVLIPVVEGDDAVDLRGVALLQGAQDHSDVVVRARVGGALVTTTFTDSEGSFTLSMAPIDHTLSFDRRGFVSLEVTALFNTQGEFEGQFTIDGVPVEEAALVLTAVPQATLSGEVESLQGPRNDWPNIAFVILTGGDERRIVPVANDEGGRGQFQFVALPPGDYDLSVVAQGHEPFSRAVGLVNGDNTAALISLEVEADDTAVVLQGRVSLQGEEVDGDHSGVVVRASVQGNTVTTSQTDLDGVFAFLASRQDHALSFSRQNFIPRDLLVTWNESQERFEVEGQPLADQVVALTQTPQSDRDADGVLDTLDNCPQAFNVDQRDTDGDGLGDACDGDVDGDGMVNGLDNCPLSFNPMQEDAEGLGRGLACSQGTLEDPLVLGCGVELQALDTRERPSALLGSCGGAGAPEVVYGLSIAEGETWSVRVEAGHTVVVYLLDAQGQERMCTLGGRVEFSQGETLPAGRYRLVVDGFSGRASAGPINVSIRSQACSVSFGHRSHSFFFGDSPGFVVLEDVTGDGNLDVIASARNPDRVRAMYGDGQGNFVRARNLLTGGSVGSVATGDFNSDGVLDIIAVHDGNAVSLFRGNGQEGFSPETAFSVGDNPSRVAVADFNMDENLDIVTLNSRGQDISLLLGDGEGGFGEAQTFEIDALRGALAAGDLNGDAHPDLVIRADGSSVGVVLNDGEGGFGSVERFAIGNGDGEVGLLDADRDGALDVVTVNLDSRNISVLMGDGRGRLAPHQTYDVGTFARRLALGDANGDGIVDITVDSVRTFFGDGYGAFSDVQISEREGRSGPMAMGDVNNDGTADLVNTDSVNDRVIVSFGDAEGVFALQDSVEVGFRPFSVVLGHINSDAHLDVLTTDPSNNEAQVSLGDGEGGFSETGRFAVGIFPGRAILGDLNVDGHLDVVTANSTSGDISVLLGDGQGNFADAQSFAVGSSATDLAMGDLNGDEAPDVVVSRFGFEQVGVLFGDGQGGLLPIEFVPVNIPTTALVLGDMNNDQALDIVISDDCDSQLSVVLGDGAGGFDTPRIFISGVFPASLALGDVNEDGALDVVTANTGGRDLSLHLGDGQGGLSDPLFFETPGSGSAVALRDVNGDRHLDMLAIDIDSAAFYLFLGDGAGAFSPLQTFSVGDFPSSMALGDLDGDGRLDVAVGTRGRVNILRHRSLQTQGTRLVDASLPPCPSIQTPLQTFNSGTPGFLPISQDPCRIDRLELDLDFEPETLGAISMTTPLGHSLPLRPLRPGPGVWRPEVVPELARLETHPLTGPWTLLTDFVLDSAQMLVNFYPSNPFDPDTLADACTPDVDQSAEQAFVCRLPDTFAPPLPEQDNQDDDFTLDDEADEDVFLLEGDFGGAFIEGQTLVAFVAADPDSTLIVELRALRARLPLAVAQQNTPGVWSLSWTIPPEYSGRFFAIHVRGQGVDGLPYDLRAGSGEPLD